MEPITDTVLWPDGPEADPPSLPGLLHLPLQHNLAFSDVTSLVGPLGPLPSFGAMLQHGNF